MRPYQLLVFDWDGTLADSLEQIVAAMQQAVDSMSLKRRSAEAIRNLVGLGLAETAVRLYPELDKQEIDKLIQRYRESYIALSAAPLRLFPGAAELIEALHQRDYRLALATGKSRVGLERALRESGIGHLFHSSRCADETFSKPHPQMLQELMDALGIDRRAALMIGDSEYDLQMANNAGVSSIAVNYGAQSAQHLLKFKPLLCLDRLSELLPWLEEHEANQE